MAIEPNPHLDDEWMMRPPGAMAPPPVEPFAQAHDSEDPVATARAMNAPAPTPPPAPTSDGGGRGALRMIDALASGLSQRRTGQGFDARFWLGLKDRDKQEAAAARQLRLQDPNSPESIAARGGWNPYFKAAGWSPEEINGVSAAQLGKMDVGGLVTARQKLQAEQAQRDKAAQDKLDAEGRGNTEWNRRNAATSEQAMDRAKVMAGIADQRAVNQAYLTDALTGKRQAEQEATREQHEDAQHLRENTKQYGQALQKTGITQARKSLDKINRLAEKLRKKNGGALLNADDDKIRRGADLLQQPSGYSLMSDPDAKELMREVQALRNNQIHDLNGGAVSNSEFGRTQAAQGSSVFNSPDDMLRWTETMSRGLDSDQENLLGGFGPEVKTQYEKNLAGSKPARPADHGPPVPGMVRVRDPKSGATKDIPAGNAAAAKARGLEVL